MFLLRIQSESRSILFLRIWFAYRGRLTWFVCWYNIQQLHLQVISTLTSPLTLPGLISLKSHECLELPECFLKSSEFHFGVLSILWTCDKHFKDIFFVTYPGWLNPEGLYILSWDLNDRWQTKGPFCSLVHCVSRKNVQLLRHLHRGSVMWVHMLSL